MLRANTLTLSHANIHSDTRYVHVRVCLFRWRGQKRAWRPGSDQARGWDEKRGSKRKVSEQGWRKVEDAEGITGTREM